MSISLSENLNPNQLTIPRRIKVLSAPLLNEQRKHGLKKPVLDAQIYPYFAGVPRLCWQKLYSGTEEDGSIALAFDGQGSLYRGRSLGTNPAVYRQKVTNPAPGSDFSNWTQAFSAKDGKFALCAQGAEICFFYFNPSDYNYIYQHRSTNYGATWTSSKITLYLTPNYATNYLAADFKPNGDIYLFNANYHPNYTGRAIVYVLRRINNLWDTYPTIILEFGQDIHTGIAVKYDGDWNLLITIKRGNIFYLYKVIYGDGYRLREEQTSTPEVVMSMPAGQGYEWYHPFLINLPQEKRHSFLMSFSERYTGQEAISRPFLAYGLKETDFYDTLWREPLPFNCHSQYGLALACFGNYAWAATPSGVWRAPIVTNPITITETEILSLDEDITQNWAQLTLEIDNAKGSYQNLNRGDEIRLSGGYYTKAGRDKVELNHYWIERIEHRMTNPNQRTLVLTALSPWQLLDQWTPRHSLRWQQNTTVYHILRQILAKVGIPLDIVSVSPTCLGFMPDFAINPGDNGLNAVKRLLSFVPDVLIFCQGKAYLVNPAQEGVPVYEYGSGSHPILEVTFTQDTPEITHVQVLGRSDTTDIIVEDFIWGEIQTGLDRLSFVPDLSLTTIPQAKARAQAILSKQLSQSVKLVIPPDFARELYDLVTITTPVIKAQFRLKAYQLSYRAQTNQLYAILSLAQG